MAHSINVIMVVSFVEQLRGTHLEATRRPDIRALPEKVASQLVDRAFQVVPCHSFDLDDTTLAKHGQRSATTCGTLRVSHSNCHTDFKANGWRRSIFSNRVFQTAIAVSLADIAADAFTPESYKVAALFPGQGVQSVGMGVALAEKVPKAKELFDKASKILGYDLLRVCREGPQEKLDSSAVCQPAMFVTSMAAVEKLKMDKGEHILNDVAVTMGLSLGEYSALCFAGAISFEDGVRLAQEGGAAMQDAADLVDSSMAAVIGLESDTVVELCQAASEKSGETVQIANYLCKGNYVVSGSRKAVETVIDIAQSAFNARKVVKLAVVGAFHTEFMRPGEKRLRAVLETIDVKEPRIPVVFNFDAKAHKDPSVIKEIMALHLTSPVRWEDAMAAMLTSDFESAYELGHGKVLTGILKRFDARANISNVGAS